MFLLIFHSTYNRPILLVGNGVRSANAEKEVIEFCKKTHIPVLTTMNGVDLAQDEFHLGFIGTHGNRVANLIINQADLVISVGARLGLRQVGRYREEFAPNSTLIRVDVDEYELSRVIKANEEKYHMDAKVFMTLLLQETVPDYTRWNEKCKQAKAILDSYDKTQGNRVVEKISSLLPENPIVTLDVGQNECWCAQSLELKGNNGRILVAGGYGSMGCSLPFAVGVSIAEPCRPVYSITGDGGLQMNIQELETVKRENLPIKIIVLNNRTLGKISETQHKNHNDRYAQTTLTSGYSVPDFARVAEAYGIESFTIDNYEELDFYKEKFLDNNAYLFNIMMSEESYLIPKIKWETNKIEPLLPEKIEKEVMDILCEEI